MKEAIHYFKKTKPSESITQVLIYLFIGIFSISTLLPFVYVVAGSFATERELVERSFFIFPREISYNAYYYIFKNGDAINGLKNSTILTVVGVFISMSVSCTLAYPLSRRYFRGRNVITTMVIITMLFSGGMIPSYMMIVNILKLKNTYWALWLPAAMNAFNMIIIKNYFQGIPQELEEAAIVDGYNDLGIFFRIVLPLSKPVLASVGLFYAVAYWNSYFNAMLYINDQNKEVIQIVLRRIVFLTSTIATEDGIDWGTLGEPPSKAVKMATTVVATVPMLMIYPFIQKYFTKGVMLGSVKG